MACCLCSVLCVRRCLSWSELCHDLMFFFFNDTATTEIYTLSLHDALPISQRGAPRGRVLRGRSGQRRLVGQHDRARQAEIGRARLNSSHDQISYAVFCLKKKKTNKRSMTLTKK